MALKIFTGAKLFLKACEEPIEITGKKMLPAGNYVLTDADADVSKLDSRTVP